jgi:hypothetical protein
VEKDPGGQYVATYRIVVPAEGSEVKATGDKFSPFVKTPSTGDLSPFLTTTSSPIFTSEAGKSTKFPFLMTLAIFGCRSTSAVTASAVLALVRISSHLPKRTKAIRNTEVSNL